jgi:hypothetical protein
LTETDDPVPESLSMIAVQFSYIDPDTYTLNDNMPSDDEVVYSFHSADYHKNTSIWNGDLDTMYAEGKKAGPLQDWQIWSLYRLHNGTPNKDKELWPVHLQVLSLDGHYNAFFLVQHRHAAQVLVVYDHA